jgi:acyl dehydratase
MPPIETRQTLTRADVMLYALGVGSTDLAFVYEDGLSWQDPRFGVNWRRVLHGETSVTIHAPLPVEGELIGRTTIGPIFDKGAEKGAIAYQTREIHLRDGAHIATVRNATMLRNEGGFGGTGEGQPPPHPIPDRPADIVHVLPTAANQAMIYRLSGDLNPLHIDPAVAEAAGFPRPILHGLATYGFAGRAVLATLCDNQAERLKRLDVRFSKPMFPGETIKVEIWRESDDETGHRAAFRATVEERGEIVLNNGYAEFA